MQIRRLSPRTSPVRTNRRPLMHNSTLVFSWQRNMNRKVRLNENTKENEEAALKSNSPSCEPALCSECEKKSQTMDTSSSNAELHTSTQVENYKPKTHEKLKTPFLKTNRMEAQMVDWIVCVLDMCRSIVENMFNVSWFRRMFVFSLKCWLWVQYVFLQVLLSLY